ncbi:MAG: EthD family reductase [Bacteroidota bacterium]
MNLKTVIWLAALSLLIRCQPATSIDHEVIKVGAIKVTIMYANGEDKVFDMDYYADKHMPMLADLFGDAMKKYEIDLGIRGRTPDDEASFLAIGYLYFVSLSDYEKAFASNAEKILTDIPNYTNVQPIVQISQIVK